MNQPYNQHIPIHLLAAWFNHKFATYKFYWFLSILQAIEKGITTIDKQQVSAGIIANV